MSRTIAAPVVVEGVGLHTGARARVTLLPRTTPGILFRRADLPGAPPIPATPSFLADAMRHTVLSNGAASIATVEHLLAACWGTDVSALEVAVEGPELPIGDGSPLIWTDALDTAGSSLLDEDEPNLIACPVRVSDGARSITLAPAPAWSVHFAGDFPDGRWCEATWTPATDFASELAGARTFCRLSEVIALRRANHIRGGNPGNSLVWVDAPPTESLRDEVARWWPGVSLTGTSEGLLEPQRLRWPDECARHKLVDLLGDLALVRPLGPCTIEAEQSGHALAHRLVRRCARAEKLPGTSAGLEACNG